MNPVRFLVRCYVKRDGDQWVAVSIDLGLAAQGETCAEARERLKSQILSYVNDAVTVDAEHAEELLSRKAPLSQQLEYFAMLGAHKLIGQFANRKAQHKLIPGREFTLPLPMVPMMHA